MPASFLLVCLLLACLLCWACDDHGPAPSGRTEPIDLPGRLERHVRFLAGIDPPRSYRHPDSQARVVDYIADHFQRAGLAVLRQTYTAEGQSFVNVIGRLGPTGRPRLVLGAHYDVCGEMPGADDNASGVAGLIESAFLLAGHRLPLTVELVAYACEEPPFFGSDDMGSYRHAASLRQAGVDVRAMLCYEMIGYFSDRPDSQSYPLPGLGRMYPTTGNYIGVVGRSADKALVLAVARAMQQATDLPVQYIASPLAGSLFALSDHRNYWRVGYPAVMLCDTAFYRNAHYHQPTDTPQTLDYQRMAQVVLGTCAAVVLLAAGPPPDNP